jgi:nitroreductase
VIFGKRLRKEEVFVNIHREVSDDLLNEVLEAVKWAPSWANTQCWEVIVIKDPGVKHALADVVSPKNPATRAVASAPIVLSMCAKLKSAGYYKDTAVTKFGDWFMFDLGLATQNLCLAAQDLGLGTVIVGLFDHDRANRLLNLPEGYDCVVLVPLGYPSQTPRTPKRKDVTEFTYQNTF